MCIISCVIHKCSGYNEFSRFFLHIYDRPQKKLKWRKIAYHAQFIGWVSLLFDLQPRILDVVMFFWVSWPRIQIMLTLKKKCCTTCMNWMFWGYSLVTKVCFRVERIIKINLWVISAMVLLNSYPVKPWQLSKCSAYFLWTQLSSLGNFQAISNRWSTV